MFRCAARRWRSSVPGRLGREEAPLSRTPAFVHGRGPSLREHNRYVYGELLGLSDEEMRALEAEKVI